MNLSHLKQNNMRIGKPGVLPAGNYSGTILDVFLSQIPEKEGAWKAKVIFKTHADEHGGYINTVSKSYRVSSKNPGVFKRDFGLFFSPADINEIVADVVERRHIMVGHKLRNKRADFRCAFDCSFHGLSAVPSMARSISERGCHAPGLTSEPNARTLHPGCSSRSQAAIRQASSQASF